MPMIRTYLALSYAVLMLTGFTWGFGTDKCPKALELTGKLGQLRDEAQIRQTEADILSLCPDGAAGHYVTALQFERAGNLDGAIAEYRKALQLERSFPLASGNLGLLYAQKGMNDEASVELARGLSSIPNPKYQKAMAMILAERKVYPLAIYYFNEAGRELTNDAGVFTGLAEIYVAIGQHGKAMEEYRRALAADPDSEKAHIGIAAIHLERNEPNHALDELKKAAVSSPQNRQIHLMMAEIYAKKGENKLAEYERLLGGKGKTPPATPAAQAVPSPTASPSLAVAEPVSATSSQAGLEKEIERVKTTIKEQPDAVAAYEELGNLYRSAGMDKEAIAAYKEAVYRNSTSSDVYLNLGILYEKQDLLDEAVVAYRQALHVKPQNADARLRLADIYLNRGSNAQAVEQYGEFLKLKPNSPDIQLKLARIFARTKETNLAIEGYQAVLKQSPDNVDANREIAALYKAKGLNDKAIEHYNKVLAQQKDDVETRNALVSLYVKDKRYDEITDLLKGTAELFPDDPNNYYKLGLIYDFKKDFDNAIASYKKALELKPDHARSLNALGRLYLKTGRLSEAKEMLEAAKKADPNLEEASVLLNNIREEFNPEPRKISSKIGSRHKKGKSRKGKKTKASKNGKSTKSGKSKARKKQ
jgi:tetratricopeptide (TPR) repeat protein